MIATPRFFSACRAAKEGGYVEQIVVCWPLRFRLLVLPWVWGLPMLWRCHPALIGGTPRRGIGCRLLGIQAGSHHRDANFVPELHVTVAEPEKQVA